MTFALIDTHCHLDAAEFASDREDVIKRAADNGVAAILTLGTDLESSRKAVGLSGQYVCVYAGVGLHPNDAAKHEDGLWVELRKLAEHPKVIAWGEIGLDYHWNFASKEQQLRVFRKQLNIARELDLSVVVHIRKAHEDTLAILSEPEFVGLRGILHCWSGDLQDAKRAVDMGHLIGVGGPVTYKKSILPEIVAELPWESMVVETDAPYLAPVPLRGRRNEPALVRHTFERLVEIKGDRSPVDAARTLWSNFLRLFPRFHDVYETAARE